MTIPMAEFIWPSDQDRADNDELNRVCEYLEEVMDERDAALEREQALAREASYHQQEIDSLLGRLRKTQNERDVHMAHSARVNEVLFKTFSAIEDGDESALPYDEYRDAFNDAPTASLAKRDLIKQAEALEHRADCIMENAGYLENFRREVAGILRSDAKRLRQRAQEEAAGSKSIPHYWGTKGAKRG